MGEEMTYTIGQLARLMKLPVHTIRYYDKEGLLPSVERTESGRRIFKDSDLEWVAIIECMKDSGRSMEDIREYITEIKRGEITDEKRLKIYYDQKELIEKRMLDYQKYLEIINQKIQQCESTLRK